MPVDFCLLDSRVAATALEQSPYQPDSVCQPAAYVEPSGIYLQLFGRAIDGSSVAAEVPMSEGLALHLLDEHDSFKSDGEYASAVLEELLQRACEDNPNLTDSDDIDDISTGAQALLLRV